MIQYIFDLENIIQHEIRPTSSSESTCNERIEPRASEEIKQQANNKILAARLQHASLHNCKRQLLAVMEC
jgi:hypothetical protein